MAEEDSDTARKELALAAASQASEALAELLRFAREGDYGHGGDQPFHPDVEPVEKLLDAAKLAIEASGDDLSDDDLRQVLGAIEKFLSGWA